MAVKFFCGTFLSPRLKEIEMIEKLCCENCSFWIETHKDQFEGIHVGLCFVKSVIEGSRVVKRDKKKHAMYQYPQFDADFGCFDHSQLNDMDD